MKLKPTQAFLLSLTAAISSAQAGDWCKSLEDLGEIYKNKKNDWIQEVELFGRANYQWGYTDGEFNGRGFSGSGGEMRRLRFGTKISFLQNFELEAGIRLTETAFRQTKFGYAEMDDLTLSYDFGDIGKFEDVTVTYGRQKFSLNGEWHTSSTDIKTIERSALSNFYGRSRATGLVIEANCWDTDFAVGFIAPDSSKELASWGGGVGYYFSADLDLGKDENLIFDFLYMDAESVENEIYGYDWVASVTYDREIGDWDLLTNFIYGDTGSENVYGIIILPSTYLIKDRLELALRYQWAHSNGDSFELNERNVGSVSEREIPTIPEGRGNEHHSVYAGLNYYLCGDNAKIMVGVEYDNLNSDVLRDVEATTLWAAFRMYF